MGHLIWRPTGFLQCFDTVGWVIWPVKIVPEMTYNVLSGTLSLYTTTTRCRVYVHQLCRQQSCLSAHSFTMHMTCTCTFWPPWNGVVYNFSCVCLSVCQTITFERFDVGSSYLHIRCISSEYGSGSHTKVTESKSRSQEQKNIENLYFHNVQPIGNNFRSIKHRAMKSVCNMGFLAMADWMVWLPSLSRDRKWQHVTKWTHSRVISLRLEGNLVAHINHTLTKLHQWKLQGATTMNQHVYAGTEIVNRISHWLVSIIVCFIHNDMMMMTWGPQ